MPDRLLRRRIGSAVAREREMAGLTQTELARAVRIAQNTLSRYEAGERAIPVDTMAALARSLCVPVGSFLPVEELPTDWRSALSLMDSLTAEDRALVVGALISVMESVRRHDMRASSWSPRFDCILASA